MRLAAGTRLGPYEIVEPIGAGGMGVVYRGRDTRLSRDVAIKVLPPESSDQASRDRFAREARAVAALTHPHICAIHDVGSDGESDYLVLELIEGESLAARLQRGPMTLDEAVTCGSQIAAAVGHAHRAGIVHRDLKPANVMLTRSGVKVLDFGLARILGGTEPAGSTVTAMMQTSPGTIMGTLPYMSPEQIEGRSVDARADVFAFGAMLYEMLTAKRAFDAPSGPALMASILRDQSPSLRAADASFPAAIDRVIHTCLAKDPDDRFSDINDAVMALRWAGEDARGGSSANSVPPPSAITRRVAIAAGFSLIGGAAGYWLGSDRRPSESLDSYTFDIPLPSGFRSGPGLALSPDGRWIAASFNPDQTLWLYDLLSGTWVRPRNVVTNVLYPFWSPDGSELGYLSAEIGSPEAKLWRVLLPDGVPVPICDFSGAGARAGAWLQDNTIVLAAGLTPLYKVNASGGAPREFIPLAEGEQSLRFPTAAGQNVIYLVQRPGQRSELRTASLDGARRSVIAAPTQQSGVTDRGYLFFSMQGVVMGQPYVTEGGTLSGEPKRVPHDAIAGAMNVGHLQVAAGGGHVAVLNEHRARRQLVWRDRAGVRLAEVAGLADAQAGLELSPDRRRAAVSRGAPEHSGSQLWIVDLESGAQRRLLTSAFDDVWPVWNADGTRLLFRSLRGAIGNGNLYSVNVDGPPLPTTVDEGGFSMYPAGWTSDQSAVWSSDSASRPEDAGIWITSAGQRRQLVRAVVDQARLSADGTRIAYASSASGRQEVYVDSFPLASGAPSRVSSNGGTQPRWREDGRELYFLEGTALMASTIGPSSALAPSAPTRLFNIANDGLVGGPYAPAQDGSRFLVIEDRTAASFSVKLTLNWAASASTDRRQD